MRVVLEEWEISSKARNSGYRIAYPCVITGRSNLRFVCSSWSLLHKLRSQQANGGTVVQLEINADMVLVDHARKDCPVGSISWTWVEQSLKNGTLEDIEDHRAGPVHAPVREVGSTQPTKKTRTKFSPEDDKILMEWVIRAEQRGSSILGQTIYQQLAQKVMLPGRPFVVQPTDHFPVSSPYLAIMGRQVEEICVAKGASYTS
ncbi:MAG: hypothetical protein CL912_18855 [Deltaproteobacteria bacterium]|nr:hypothetical protein [Deltaproteobacteria bacterium]|tara:strand:- start:679 stop:1287 length:609 start_codon:yes stop_codon:yes gene_type:complete